MPVNRVNINTTCKQSKYKTITVSVKHNFGYQSFYRTFIINARTIVNLAIRTKRNQLYLDDKANEFCLVINI